MLLFLIQLSTSVSSTLPTLFEDSRIWTFSLTVSAGLVCGILGVYVGHRAARKSDTFVPTDTDSDQAAARHKMRQP